jgi:hypothetical protein
VTGGREAAGVVAVAVVGGVLLLAAEPVLGLVVLAGVGAAALLQPRARLAVAVVVLLVGAGVLWVAWSRGDMLAGAGGMLVTLSAAAAAVRSRGWPPPRRGAESRRQREVTSRDTWDALDRGEDPTV